MNHRRRGNCCLSAARLSSCRDFAIGVAEPLEMRALLSNLAITDAFLVDGTDARISSPILGEQLEVRAAYSTSGLTASASYAVRVVVDGMAVDRAGVTFGAGIGSGTWLADVFHGFAETGNHTVQVILDPLNQISEDNENDNTLTFSMTPVKAGNFPQKLGNFVAGTAGVDWRITNFADLDPRPGVLRDYLGGQFTYDTATSGHDAIDLGPGSFSATDRGIAIYAAADGIVQAINDGADDHNTGFANPAAPANYVIVDLGNGWQTKYWHLRRDSVSVKVGDTIKAGDFLGWMGSSGFSTGPHVHFELTYKNHPVETMLDQATYWITPPAYPPDYRHAISSGFTSLTPTTSEWNEQPEDIRTFTPGSRVYFWVIAGAMMPGDTRTIRYQRPDGTVFFEQINEQGSEFYKASQWYYFVTLAANAPLGTWTTTWLQNNVELARQTYTVAAVGVPEIRVEQGTQLMRDQRFTPIDFGTVAAGAAAPTQSFTITNQGSGPLRLGSISPPTGYAMASSPTATVQPGETTTLMVSLLTTAAGYFGGELRMVTNDADEPVFRIWLEGIVETPAIATLIPGISVRSAPEGSRFYANVRRTGSTASAVTVALSADASELSVPANVTIPAGSSFVNFEVQAVQDFSTDGDQRVQLVASASDLASGQNEVLVQDVFAGRLIVTETDGATSVSESGLTDQVSVALSAQPASDVVVEVISENAAEVTASPTALVFTSTNWSTPQLVTVSTVDDYLIDGTRTTNVRIVVKASLSDSRFVVAPAESVAVLSSDNDVAGFEIQQSGGRTFVRENGPADSLSLVLTAQPTSPVVIRAQLAANAEITLSARQWTFDSSNWNVVQTLQVSAVDDRVEESSEMFGITFSVDAGASDAASETSPVRTVDVTVEDDEPKPPQVRGPSKALLGAPVTISWTAVANAVDYELWVNFSSGNVAQIVHTQVTGTSFTINGFNEMGSYRVWVRAAVASGFTTRWSGYQDIRVTGQIALQAMPRYVDSATPVFSWNAVPTAVRYDLWVDDVFAGRSQVIRRTDLTATSYAVTSSLPMGLYRVWVRAIDARGEATAWSVRQEFSIAPKPSTDPTPLLTFDRTPTLRWKTVSGARSYEIWLRDSFTGEDKYRVSDVQQNEWTIPADLTVGRFQWRVRAIGDYGVTGLWSTSRDVWVVGWPAVFTAPVGGNSRVWVRATSTSGEMSQWGRESEFTVARVEQPELALTLVRLSDPEKEALQILKGREEKKTKVRMENSMAIRDALPTPNGTQSIAERKTPVSPMDAPDVGEITRFWTLEDPVLEFLSRNWSESAQT